MEPMKNHEVERLAFTLRNSGIAYSESEARRMAQNMVSTEKKVQSSFENFRAEKDKAMDKKKLNTMGSIAPEPVNEIDEMQETEDLEIKDFDEEQAKRENIERMRQNAAKSKPVEIQVDYDTPSRKEPDNEVSLKELMDEDAENIYAEGSQEQESLPVVELEEVPEKAEPAIQKPSPQPEPKKTIDTSAEQKVDLSSMFNFGSR